MKIVVSIASAANNTERSVLKSFYEGIETYYFEKHETVSLNSLKRRHNIDLTLCYDQNIPTCDIAVQFGGTKDRNVEHHQTKQNIFKNAKRIIFIETPILGRVIDNRNYYQFYRVGLDGFLNLTGKFFHDHHKDPNRLENLIETGDISDFKGWQDKKNNKILILGQLPGDSSLRGLKFGEWILDTVEELRQITDIPIDIRMHPAISAKGLQDLFCDLWPINFKNYKKLTWSNGTDLPLDKALSQVDVCVTYTSGAAIDSIMCGIPVITLDPGCLAYPISSHFLDEIECPKKASSEQVFDWMNNLVNSQWNRYEMRSGKVWRHLLPILEEDIEINV